MDKSYKNTAAPCHTHNAGGLAMSSFACKGDRKSCTGTSVCRQHTATAYNCSQSLQVKFSVGKVNNIMQFKVQAFFMVSDETTLSLDLCSAATGSNS